MRDHGAYPQGFKMGNPTAYETSRNLIWRDETAYDATVGFLEIGSDRLQRDGRFSRNCIGPPTTRRSVVKIGGDPSGETSQTSTLEEARPVAAPPGSRLG